MDTRPTPYALGTQEGEALWFFGALVTFKATAEQTGGRFALIEQLAPRGVATPLHVQPEDDESFFVIEGEMTFYLEDGKPIPASDGSFVHVPAGDPHAFQVESETARFLALSTPSTKASCAPPGSPRRSESCRQKVHPTWTKWGPPHSATASRYSAPRLALSVRSYR